MPDLMRAWRACTRYDKFTKLSGLFVCTMRTFGGSVASSAKQYMASGVDPF
eukprot:CAMPEP_0179340876 /NCGR_PEP_ID=MMETSP0797-20121207/69525_1 /TAXON_ID=47934 /ORGANISM="Dinophysis acuminata, Strain DAEP01" /LENGTH=50 /DNA_ID=CAMNT_0021054889 /DNA_START=63 /DNA_END=212 /DNA_ORIENTATION=-